MSKVTKDVFKELMGEHDAWVRIGDNAYIERTNIYDRVWWYNTFYKRAKRLEKSLLFK